MIKRVGLRYTIVFTRKSLSERVRLDRLRECYTRYAATVSAARRVFAWGSVSTANERLPR